MIDSTGVRAGTHGAAADTESSPWTRATTTFWQTIDTSDHWQGRMRPPWRYGVPVSLSGGGVLELPIRPLPGSGNRAVASLIANQASLTVVERLGHDMGVLAAGMRADVVVGLPTLGFAFAPLVARGLGHARWVPLGYSRKFWYDDALSALVRSITSPGAGKRIYLDPNMLPLLEHRSVLLVDDAVSSGSTMAPVWDLMTQLGISVAGAVVAMRQGPAGAAVLGSQRAQGVAGVFDSPLLMLKADGWWPDVDLMA